MVAHGALVMFIRPPQGTAGISVLTRESIILILKGKTTKNRKEKGKKTKQNKKQKTRQQGGGGGVGEKTPEKTGGGNGKRTGKKTKKKNEKRGGEGRGWTPGHRCVEKIGSARP